jgi:endonuclease YncB( thermonuclease family)
MFTRSVRSLAALVLALSGLVGVTFTTTSQAAAVGDRDCGDFGSQAAAQNFFLDNGGPQSDPHALDADGDGVACESNPCPCNESTGGGGIGGGDGDSGNQTPIKRQAARIIEVIDGDTVRVKLQGGPTRDVRLLGIDTPEVYGGVECGGEPASKKLKTMLPRNTRVMLISDRTQSLTDRYDRMLRYVMKGKIDTGKAQLRRGMAKVYTFDKRVSRYNVYDGAQAQAKRRNVGNWRNCW